MRNFKRVLSMFMVFAMVFSSLSFIQPAIVYGAATDLFFSEYIEGSSNNKALEIFNGTGSTVDLSAYSVELYSNGSVTAGYTATLSGLLANNAVYIIANSSAVAAIKDKANLISTVTYFNGDDAVVLKNNGQIIDVIGQVGFRPVSEWGSGLTSTADNTLVRKSTTTSGDAIATDLFDPSMEWDGYPTDTFSYLGSHTMDGSGGDDATAPVISHTPFVNAIKGLDIKIMASITSDDTVTAAVYYGAAQDGTDFTDKLDLSETDGVYSAKLPADSAGELYYYIAAANSAGMTTIPSDITNSNRITIRPVGTIAEARAATIGNVAAVSGVVTFIDGDNYYIQDATGAIDIYKKGLSLSVGDMVSVTGPTLEYKGLLEIAPVNTGDVYLTGSGNALPTPLDIKVADIAESIEGQRVRIKGATLGTTDTSNNTPITDSTGTINIYKMPALTGIVAGDTVDVTAIVSCYNSFQLRVASASDIQKVDQGTDITPPVILHTPVSAGHISKDLAISAEITDDKQVTAAKLYYRVKNTETYVSTVMSGAGNLYSAVIPKAELSTSGIQYYIEATDSINTATSPADISTPYEVAISDADILGPQITAVVPANNAVLADTEVRPAISAAFSDASGIDASSVKLLVDGTDVTAGSAVQESGVSYQMVQDLSLGKHTVLVQVSDKLGNMTEYTWNFMIGEIQYNHYYGQLHSHTGEISDGQGTLDEAYTWARDEGDADFFAVTDHSNWFDNDTANEDITDISQSTSSEWKLVNSKADQYNKDGEFVAIAGFEMTWSGSTGGWGHINTFNTPWFVSRSNSSMDLESYYSKIASDTASISQLNHPGTTFGDFDDFGYYSKTADDVVNLIEVGNGEGVVGSSGYFPSYEYYTRALDKGWHVAPSNNQDNHKAGWITANDARTVVLSTDLTRSSIYDAIRNMRVYATEDKNLKINYKVNRNPMGSILDSPDKLEVYISVEDPDSVEGVGEISIISDGGTEVASKTFEGNTALWELELDPNYSYYYVRVDQEDGDIAVTAPVWTGEVIPVGISKVEVSQDPQIVNDPVDISATVYNNGANALYNVMVEFYRDSIAEGNKLGDATIISIPAGNTGKATVSWTADTTGSYNLYARTVINIDGAEKVFSGSTAISICDPEDVTKVVLDRAHYNAYISGDYAGKDITLRAMLKDRKYMLVENNDELTASDLENTKLLIITDPQSTDKSDTLKKSLFTDAEVAAIKTYMDNGGSLILCTKADYKDGTGEYSNGVQLNKILEAISADLRVNDDEVVDYTSNGGSTYRLYFNRYTSSKYGLTEGIPEGTTYSFYSGASVVQSANGDGATIDWLVKGHETTETIDSDYQGDNIPVTKGDVDAIGAELLDSGAKLIVAGTIFFSDFETAASDNAYSNKQITDNILNWMIPAKEIPLKTIAEVRADSDNDGVPDLMGEKFAVEGIVTAQSEAVTPKNAFFEVIYIQDETGGITVFGVSATPLPLGTKVRVTGIVDQYDGDTELSVGNESVDIKLIGSEITPVEPRLIGTGDSMLESNEGWLVKIQGKVTRMSANSLYLDDGTGEARVYVNGYIGDGTGNVDMLGKWDASIAVGDTVSAVGLASEDPEGHRLRVRNTGEIVKLGSKVTGISLDKTEARLSVNEKLTLAATLQPSDAFNRNIVWNSSNTAVAKVENGVVTATGRGTAVITATTVDGGYKATCNISVKGVYVPVKGIMLSRTEAEVKVGRTVMLKALVLPGNATHREIVWSSSDTDIAAVANGIVTGLNGGTAVITAETIDGGYKATCNIKVDGSPVPVKGVLLNRQLELVKIGRNLELKAIVLPWNAADKTVEWSSSDTRVATVENGVVTAKAAGMAVIQVKTKQGGFTAHCVVFVTRK